MAATDAISVLMEDHREVEAMFTELQSLSGTDKATLERKGKLAEEVVIELVRHSVAEEEYLYPTAREVLPDGAALADHEINEHTEAERTMKALEGMSPDNIEFDSTVRTLITQVTTHVEEEEGTLFPRLREACSADQLREMGEKIEMAKKMAPTRPHPSSPSTPPANKMLGPGVGLIDRLRDALTGRGAKG